MCVSVCVCVCVCVSLSPSLRINASKWKEPFHLGMQPQQKHKAAKDQTDPSSPNEKQKQKQNTKRQQTTTVEGNRVIANKNKKNITSPCTPCPLGCCRFLRVCTCSWLSNNSSHKLEALACFGPCLLLLDLLSEQAHVGCSTHTHTHTHRPTCPLSERGMRRSAGQR